MKISISKLSIGLLLVASACAAPSEPSSLSSSGVGNSSAATAAGNPLKSPGMDFGGALVGDATMQAAVKKCVDTGKFFDRKGQKCSDLALAQVNCKESSIKSIMKGNTKTGFEKLLNDPNQLGGYLLDQCLNCASPVGNAFCEGAKDQKTSEPGVRLYFVKESSGNISMKSVYIPN